MRIKKGGCEGSEIGKASMQDEGDRMIKLEARVMQLEEQIQWMCHKM